ncbi:MAG: UvrD-helicase domain-containing protein [Bacteriovoracaceae bacterium]
MYLNIEKELNKEQLKAVTTIDGPILILAGAGSGKTKTITYRMYYMIEVMKINPENILAVSFTNKAALEMEHRLRKLIGGSKADKTQLSTFHSLGVKILKQEIEKLGYQKNFDIFDTSDQLSVVREALYHLKAEKNFDRKVILQKIGLLKNMGISEEDFKDSNQYDAADPYDEACEHVYHYYQEKLKFYNAIDFDDILFLTIKLFRNFPDVKNRYSAKFKYIMVDEYQDTNDLQFELIRHLTATHNNICVVGDDDQSIYAFRGANVTNILNFPDYFKPCTIIKLEQNYRSHQSILHLANNVIKNNVKRSDKKLWTDLPEGEKPMLWSCLDPDHEVSLIVEEIQKMQKNGVVLSDVAILFRSNSQMQIVEDQLRLNNIPHYIVGGQKFYDKKEIKDIISYLSLIQNFNNDIALRRVINTPHRGIGKTTLEKYIEFGKSHKCSILNAMIKNPNLDPHKSDKIAQFTGLIFRYKSIFNTTPLPDSIKSLLMK